jgi:hypothetical protein
VDGGSQVSERKLNSFNIWYERIEPDDNCFGMFDLPEDRDTEFLVWEVIERAFYQNAGMMSKQIQMPIRTSID